MLRIKGLLVLVLGVILAPEIQAQSENTEIVKVLVDRSAYVTQVFYQLVFAHVNAKFEVDPKPIPEPMTFDNFTYNHLWLLQNGESHTYNPLLFGFSNSILTVNVDNDTYKANIRLVIPQASLTGAYDLWIDKYNIFGEIETRLRGSGAYAHTFSNVDLWLNFTLSEGIDGGLGQPLAIDITTSLVFESCRLWAGNFSTNGDPWDDAKWERQGPKFKQAFDEDEKSGGRDILLREGARSYFNIYFGFGEYTRLQALHLLIELGNMLNP